MKTLSEKKAEPANNHLAVSDQPYRANVALRATRRKEDQYRRNQRHRRGSLPMSVLRHPKVSTKGFGAWSDVHTSL